jgi:hypothetical protein
MSKFEQMTYGETVFGTKSAKLTSFENDKLHSPYDGEVVKTHHHQCDSGYLLIKHTVGKDVFYSQFCGIGRVTVTLKDNIKKGKIIGYFSNDEIVYSFLDSNFKTLNPKTPFVTEFKTEKESKENEPKNKKTKDKEPWKSDVKPGLVSFALSPIDFLGKQTVKQGTKLAKKMKDIGKDMFKLKDTEKDERLKKAREDKENDEKNKGLNENIERIKKLLK